MIHVHYKVVQDEKDWIVERFTKTFDTHECKCEFERSQAGHPWLTLIVEKVEDASQTNHP